MRELVIDRRRWLTGKHLEKHFSVLLSGEKGAVGKMCCLGFALRAEGLAKSDLLDEPKPSNLVMVGTTIPKTALWLISKKTGDDSRDCKALMKANDDKKLAPEKRESRIAALFAKHNVRVSFIN